MSAMCEGQSLGKAFWCVSDLVRKVVSHQGDGRRACKKLSVMIIAVILNWELAQRANRDFAKSKPTSQQPWQNLDKTTSRVLLWVQVLVVVSIGELVHVTWHTCVQVSFTHIKYFIQYFFVERRHQFEVLELGYFLHETERLMKHASTEQNHTSNGMGWKFVFLQTKLPKSNRKYWRFTFVVPKRKTIKLN